MGFRRLQLTGRNLVSIRGPKGPKGPYQDAPRETEIEEPITSGSDYHSLPACVKSIVSLKDYQWMGDYARSRLIEDLTQPQGIED
jgi:hypothetical protein